MIDLHYDLLTKLYTSYLNNDFKYIEEFTKNFNKDNAKGLIANICFMSKEEMRCEYHENFYNENVSVVKMFEIVTNLAKKYINDEIKIVYCIEGCDYVEIEDLKKLYNLGLRAIMLTWNEKNNYGSGIRSENGLTIKGKEFIKEAIKLGIGIDLSHANKNTFSDIIKVLYEAKNSGLSPIIYASHSNIYNLCSRDRNLYDDQLLVIKALGGIVGILSNKGFVTNEKHDISDKRFFIDEYIKHIRYLDKLFNGIDNIAVSSDDMNYCTDMCKDYIGRNIFDYSLIKNELEQELLKYYNKEQVDKILYTNASNLLDKLLI